MPTTARIIRDSINGRNRLTTFELTFGRIILPELLTHRVFSRNTRSTRAVPVNVIIQEVRDDPFVPSSFGRNRPGMQALEELNGYTADQCKQIWLESSRQAIQTCQSLNKLGLHKQVAGRVLEPYSWTKMVLTGTEFANFFALRCHKDAQPEMQELAQAMLVAYNASDPTPVGLGNWHLPYITHQEQDALPIQQLVQVSVARCCRVSYKLYDGSNSDYAKDLDLYNKLVTSGHFSPLEHVCTPLDKSVGCGNLVGWMQHRKQLSNESQPFNYKETPCTPSQK